MTDDDIKRLKRLAEQATPGPWRVNMKGHSYHEVARVNDLEIAPPNSVDLSHWTVDAAYIAAASPDVVLALLDEIERLRAAIDVISIDRQSFADFNARPDRSIDPGDATILREYDDVLAQLHAALDDHASMAQEIERLRAALAESRTPTQFWDRDGDGEGYVGGTLQEIVETACDDLRAADGRRYVDVGCSHELSAITVCAWVDDDGVLQWDKAHDA